MLYFPHIIAGLSEPAVTTSRIVVVGALIALFDEPFVKQPADVPVQRAGIEPDRALRARFDFFLDVVAVRLAVDERHQDEKNVRFERGRDLDGVSCSHGLARWFVVKQAK